MRNDLTPAQALELLERISENMGYPDGIERVLAVFRPLVGSVSVSAPRSEPENAQERSAEQIHQSASRLQEVEAELQAQVELHNSHLVRANQVGRRQALDVLSDLWLWASERRTHLDTDPVPDGLGAQVIAMLDSVLEVAGEASASPGRSAAPNTPPQEQP